jgi:high-affinity Fe2+/Pb2+ permease
VVSRKLARRLAGTAAAATAGGSFFYGLSRVAPLSLAIIGGTLVAVIVVLAFTGYKAFDRLLRHFEQQP